MRKSLELLGARLDKGYNILIYPEGKLTVGGPLQPFKAGAGLIAVEGGTPIVPVKIKIHSMSWIDRRRWPSPLRATWSSCWETPPVRRRHRPRDRDHPAAGRRGGTVGGPR